MYYFTYGKKPFTKFEGYYGPVEKCEACLKEYKKAYVRTNIWAHFDYIPIFPLKKLYNKICPICGHGYTLKRKEAKEEMANSQKDEKQNIELFAKHILANKPKKKLQLDQSYEVYAKDMITGEETLIAADIAKAVVKTIKKDRGLKKLEIIEVQD